MCDAVPYDKLPEVLRDYYVCLIPFDASTDFSAGKKVVATEIPELMSYNGKYVYCENDDDAFVDKVRLCLENKTTLVDETECVQFARENDWKTRIKKLMLLFS